MKKQISLSIFVNYTSIQCRNDGVAAEISYTLSNFEFTSSESSLTVKAKVGDVAGVTRVSGDSWVVAKIGLVFNNTGGTHYRVPSSSSSQVLHIHFLYCIITTIHIYKFILLN